MSKAKLVISGPAVTKEVLLDPKGATLGREERCDIVLDHNNISRLHARIYRDPFGRWIVEDLGSQNGVFVEEQRIKAHALLPNQKIDIRPFTLSLLQEFEPQTVPDSSVQKTASVIDRGLEEEVVQYEAGRDVILSARLIRHLNEITSHLSQLQNPSELYPEACYYLAKMLDTLVAFVRLPPSSGPLPDTPQILACHFGKSARKNVSPRASNIHLSKRVLEAVRSTRAPVMARSGPSRGRQLELTIVDETTPHVVFAAPINEFDGTVEALYLDVLEDKSPKEMFDFVEALARQINFAQKSLTLSEARAERRILDQQLALARDIQAKLTPRGLESVLGVDIAVCYEPAMWVGGDYCDVWSLENGQIAFAVGDVSGKGLPAAMVMSNLQAALRTTMTFCLDLSIVAEHVNRHLCQSLHDEMFVTLFLGLFDPSRNELTYVNAGHIPPLVKRPSEPARQLDNPANPPLGIFERPFEKVLQTVHPDTCLLVVTDGITEARSHDGQLFEMDRLAKLVTDSEIRSAKGLVESVTKSVANFRQTLAQQDDITVFALANRRIDSNERS